MPTFTPPGSAVVVPCSNDPCPACDDPNGNPSSCVDCCATFAVTIAGFACNALNGTFTFRRFATLGTTCEWSIDSSGTIRHYLTRLPDGRWSIYRDFLPTTNPCPEDGSYTFETSEPTPCPPADVGAWSLVDNTFALADPDTDPSVTEIAASDCATACACFTLFESTWDCTAETPAWTTPVAIASYCAWADELDWFRWPTRDGGNTVVRRRTVKGDDCNCDGTGDPCPTQTTPAAPTETDPTDCPPGPACITDTTGKCQRIRFTGPGFDTVLLADGPGTPTYSSAEGYTLQCDDGVWTMDAVGTGGVWTAPGDDDGMPPLDYTQWMEESVGYGDLTDVSCFPCPYLIKVTVSNPGSCDDGTVLTLHYDAGTGYWYSDDAMTYIYKDGAGVWHVVLDVSAACPSGGALAEWEQEGGGDCPPLNGSWILIDVDGGSPTVTTEAA